MTSREKYREFCKTEKTIPIFSKDWWLDAVCGKDNWGVVLIERGGKIIVTLPYYLEKMYISCGEYQEIGDIFIF